MRGDILLVVLFLIFKLVATWRSCRYPRPHFTIPYWTVSSNSRRPKLAVLVAILKPGPRSSRSAWISYYRKYLQNDKSWLLGRDCGKHTRISMLSDSTFSSDCRAP
ncbi:hypothetical protein EDB83DRAFT_2357028 [Lactarius deliciosus]|nr:hypothetical protein EDB83DRAFT_2357028 [Lactarius deliciosus]